jgi:hypothetical protein
VAAVVPGLGFPLSSIAFGCDAALARHIAARLVPVRGTDLRVRTTAAIRIAASAFHQTLGGREPSFSSKPNVLVLGPGSLPAQSLGNRFFHFLLRTTVGELDLVIEGGLDPELRRAKVRRPKTRPSRLSRHHPSVPSPPGSSGVSGRKT